MINKDQLPGDEAAELGKNDSSSQQNNNNEQDDLLRSELYDKQDMLFTFKISERTLQEWRSKKLMPFIRIRGKIFYPKKFVEEMLRKHRVG